MQLHVYGPGCGNCRRLEAQARQAVSMLGQEATVTKVTDFAQITEAGVMRTPALAVDGALVVQGRVPEASELASMIATVLARANAPQPGQTG